MSAIQAEIPLSRNDDKFGAPFIRVSAGIKILKMPVHTPRANAIGERFLGIVRRACLDHFLILSERHLRGFDRLCDIFCKSSNQRVEKSRVP